MPVLFYGLLSIGTAISIIGFRIYFRARTFMSNKWAMIGSLTGLTGMGIIIAALVWIHPLSS